MAAVVANDGLQRTGLSAECGSLEDKTEALDTQLEKEEERLLNLNSQIESVENLIKDAGGGADAMKANMQGQITETDGKIDELVPQIEDKKHSLEDETEKESALTGEIGTKKDQVAANAVTQEEKDKEIDDLMKLIEDTQAKIAATTAKIEPLPGKITATEAETQRLIDLVIKYEKEHKGMHSANPAQVPAPGKGKGAPSRNHTSETSEVLATKTIAPPMSREERAKAAEDKAKARREAAKNAPKKTKAFGY